MGELRYCSVYRSGQAVGYLPGLGEVLLTHSSLLVIVYNIGDGTYHALLLFPSPPLVILTFALSLLLARSFVLQFVVTVVSSICHSLRHSLDMR